MVLCFGESINVVHFKQLCINLIFCPIRFCHKCLHCSMSRNCACDILLPVGDMQCVICPKKGGGRVCEYMHARAIFNVLTQGQTVQKDGSNPPNPRQITPWCHVHV